MPVGFALLWKPMSTVAAIASPWIGLVCGLIAWFVTTWKRSGSISVATTGDTTNAVAGNVASLSVGLVMALFLSYAFPGKYASSDARHNERSNKIQGIVPLQASSEPEIEETARSFHESEIGCEKQTPARHLQPATSFSPTDNKIKDNPETLHNTQPMDPVLVRKGEKLAWGANILFISVAVILVPFTLFGTGYVYSKTFFTGWVVVSFIWIWLSMAICVIYPVVESTGALREISIGLWGDVKALFGVRKEKVGHNGVEC